MLSKELEDLQKVTEKNGAGQSAGRTRSLSNANRDRLHSTVANGHDPPLSDISTIMSSSQATVANNTQNTVIQPHRGMLPPVPPDYQFTPVGQGINTGLRSSRSSEDDYEDPETIEGHYNAIVSEVESYGKELLNNFNWHNM